MLSKALLVLAANLKHLFILAGNNVSIFAFFDRLLPKTDRIHNGVGKMDIFLVKKDEAILPK